MANIASSRRFWDEKACENAFWYVSSSGPYANRDTTQFWASGPAIWAEIKRATGYQPSASDTVVEVGCGVGRITRALAGEVGACHACDLSEAMLAHARAAAPANVQFRQTDGRSLHPLGDGIADLALAYCVFQHLPDEATLRANLEEMARVTKPGGWIIFTTSPRDWKSRLLPLARLRAALTARLRRGGPRGTYRKEWVGIRPSRRRVEQLSPLPLAFCALPHGRWLYWGRKPENAGPAS